MKKLLGLTIVAGSAVALSAACAPQAVNNVTNEVEEKNVFEKTYEDGVYRGNFFDQGIHQVGVEFAIKDGVVTSAKYRQVFWSNCNFLATNLSDVKNATCTRFGTAGDETAEANFKKAADNYAAALAYTVNKPLAAMAELEKGGTIVAGATANSRFNKIRFALVDGLLHGKYE